MGADPPGVSGSLGPRPASWSHSLAAAGIIHVAQAPGGSVTQGPVDDMTLPADTLGTEAPVQVCLQEGPGWGQGLRPGV